MGKPPRAVIWLTLLAGLYIGFLAGTRPLYDTDFWWHLKAGQLMVERGELLYSDVFSWTRPGAPWIAHEWGWEILLALVYGAGGWLGLIYFKAVLWGLMVLLAAWLCLRWKADPLPALVSASLLAAAASLWINARPHMLLVLYLLILLHLLTSYREGKRRVLWWSVPLFLLWVNSHGSFLIGWAVLAVFGLCLLLQPDEADLRRESPRAGWRLLGGFVLPAVLSVAICLVNPNGVPGFLYPFSYVIGENAYHTELISEYASPNFHEPLMQVLMAVLLLTAVVMILSPRTPTLFEVVLLALGSFMFLKWVRNGPVLAIFCAPLLARHLSERMRVSAPPGPDPAALPLPRPALLAAAAVLMLGFLVWLAPKDPAANKTLALRLLPAQATEVIREYRPQGRMFNTYHWGGYLIWDLWPEYPVFVDGRADMYGKALVDDYTAIARFKPSWRELLDRYRIDWLVVTADAPLTVGLAGDPRWARLYQDEVAAIYTRRGGVNQRLVEQAGTQGLKPPPGPVEPRR